VITAMLFLCLLMSAFASAWCRSWQPLLVMLSVLGGSAALIGIVAGVVTLAQRWHLP
jgi:hypothetical protein